MCRPAGSDSNPGTFAAPWLTIQHAANTATAGATVNVMGGVYNEFVSFPHSGTKGAPITFQSDPVVVGTTVQGAVIDGSDLTVSGTTRSHHYLGSSRATLPSADLRSGTFPPAERVQFRVAFGSQARALASKF